MPLTYTWMGGVKALHQSRVPALPTPNFLNERIERNNEIDDREKLLSDNLRDMYPVTVWRPAKVGLLDMLPSYLDGALVDLSPLHLSRHPDRSHLQTAFFKSKPRKYETTGRVRQAASNLPEFN